MGGNQFADLRRESWFGLQDRLDVADQQARRLGVRWNAAGQHRAEIWNHGSNKLVRHDNGQPARGHRKHRRAGFRTGKQGRIAIGKQDFSVELPGRPVAVQMHEKQAFVAGGEGTRPPIGRGGAKAHADAEVGQPSHVHFTTIRLARTRHDINPKDLSTICFGAMPRHDLAAENHPSRIEWVSRAAASGSKGHHSHKGELELQRKCHANSRRHEVSLTNPALSTAPAVRSLGPVTA